MASKSYGWDVRNIAKNSPKMVKKGPFFDFRKKYLSRLLYRTCGSGIRLLLLPFWSTTVIIFGSSSVVGLGFIVDPGVVVVFCFLSLINFLRPLLYTGLIVVFSISSVLSRMFSSSIGVLHLSKCSAVTSLFLCVFFQLSLL